MSKWISVKDRLPEKPPHTVLVRAGGVTAMGRFYRTPRPGGWGIEEPTDGSLHSAEDAS